MMIPEIQQHYRGVLCLHCRQPIPISPLIASREAELSGNKAATPQGRKCQVFNIRCAACGKEKPYTTSEIREIPGATSETYRTMPASAQLPQPVNKSKTANA
jgi:hypothetical protein